VIASFLADLDAFLGSVTRRKSVNVNDQGTKARATALATQYFSNLRPGIVQRLGETATAPIDAEWQDLIRLAQGNNSRRSYSVKLRSLRALLAERNVAFLASAPLATPRVDPLAPSLEEQRIIATLDGIVPSASASYKQGLLDLRGPDRHSYRGTAVEFREALRETLDHLAPDEAVMNQDGFKLENAQTRPTMKQKVRFVLKSRGLGRSRRESTEQSLALVEELFGDVTRAVYNRASVATHVLETKDEVGRIKRFVDTVLFDLLEIRGS
jgi:predicted pPIWI-associating nuclease